jgi:flagellar basal-body rod protein FlgC
MDFFDAIQTSSSGLSAQRLRMNLISANLANIKTTRTPEGGPYRRREAVFAARPVEASFKEVLSNRRKNMMAGVEVDRIVEDSNPPVMKYDPGHPDADSNGYVAMPNINLMEEMVNMISASRSYEANVIALKASKEMALKALEIGK